MAKEVDPPSSSGLRLGVAFKAASCCFGAPMAVTGSAQRGRGAWSRRVDLSSAKLLNIGRY